MDMGYGANEYYYGHTRVWLKKKSCMNQWLILLNVVFQGLPTSMQPFLKEFINLFGFESMYTHSTTYSFVLAWHD